MNDNGYMTIDEQIRMLQYIKAVNSENIQARSLADPSSNWFDLDVTQATALNFVGFRYRLKPKKQVWYMIRGYIEGSCHPTFDRLADARDFVIKTIFNMPEPERDPDCTGIGGVTLPPGWPKEHEVMQHIIEVTGEVSPKW